MSPREVVIVGYGMAGARLADEIRRRDPIAERVRLTVLGAEKHAAYNRVLLSAVVAGGMSAESVRLHDDEWAARHNIDLRLGVDVTRIDREKRCVELGDGACVDYDALVLATGANPWIPPVEGLEAGPGVVAFRSLDDCAKILDAARFGAPVAVLGGGLLGLEAARGLAGRGRQVTVVHPLGHVMERQLDPAAGYALALAAATRQGVDVPVSKRLPPRDLPGDFGLQLDDGTPRPGRPRRGRRRRPRLYGPGRRRRARRRHGDPRRRRPPHQRRPDPRPRRLRPPPGRAGRADPARVGAGRRSSPMS